MLEHVHARGLLVAALMTASALAVAQIRHANPIERTESRVTLPHFTVGGNAARLGDPLAGLTADEEAAFNAGLDAFIVVDTPETGLGPIFNAASCAQCHGAPATGGSSPMRITRFGRAVNGGFDPLTSRGGSMLQRLAIDPAAREVIPPEANVVADRLTTPLFGAGLIEAIPDATIIALAAQPQPDGISGRAAFVTDVASGKRRVGRFGWKAQQATILAFVGAAYVNEMGITNRLFPDENAPNGDSARLAAFDRVADIEDPVDPMTGRGDVDRLADFIRLLAPPVRRPASTSAQAGEAVFARIGCATCHQPTMRTGSSPIAALDHKVVALYSDLLLHDMGSLADGIAQGDARTREMRTAPLWGLRARNPFLHDGRAPTVDAAIRAHDGEAALVRDRYMTLPADEQRQLREFLATL